MLIAGDPSGRTPDWLMIIYTDHHPGCTKSPFTTCRVRGVYHYPDHPDFSSEAEYTFAPFGSTSLLQKLYVAVKSLFDLFYVQVECTWASKDAQMGFVQVTETSMDKELKKLSRT